MEHPHLYLDTNVILDVIDERWQASIDLMKRIKSEGWLCATSRFAVLEMLDAKQEERFMNNLLDQGFTLSQVVRRLGGRRRGKLALRRKELDAIYIHLHDLLKAEFPFITFEHPHLPELWDRAEEFCAATNIGATDSIHFATAIGVGCNILVTRDPDFRLIADTYIIATHPEDIDKALEQLEAKTEMP